MREQSSDSQKTIERNSLSSSKEFSDHRKENQELYDKQLDEIVLKKQKTIIYLSILYTIIVLLSLFYIVFIK